MRNRKRRNGLPKIGQVFLLSLVLHFLIVAIAVRIATAQATPNVSGAASSDGKNAPSKADPSHEALAQPQALYDQGGVSVIATETMDTIELAVSEPDPIFVSVEVDRNQNGLFDRLVDVAYRPQANGNLCSQYLIDSQHNTPCGGFASQAYLKDFKDEMGRRKFVLVLPKKEISFDLPSARLAFVFRDSAYQHTFFYPAERFQKAIDVAYAIKQAGAVQVEPNQNGFSEQSGNSSDSWSETGRGAGLGFGATSTPGLYKVGGSISRPILLNKVQAEYSDQARRAYYQGVCLISLIVDAQGEPQNPRVVRPLGMGLDEKALEAIRKYKFKPAMKDGATPVPVMITVAINFRLDIPCEAKVVNTLPPGVLAALNKAVKAKDFEEVIRLANQPESGLKVSWLSRNAQGRIVSYGIVSPVGCTVAAMQMTVN